MYPKSAIITRPRTKYQLPAPEVTRVERKNSMIMNKETLDAMVAKYERKADEAFRNYQETGMRRYEKVYEDATDLADTLRMAQSAHEDHTELVHWRGQISVLASMAKRAKEPEQMEKVLKELISTARMHGLTSGEG